MKEEFEYGEEVLVRDHDTEEWQKRHYLMTAPEGKFRYFTAHSDTRLDGFRISQFAVYPFAQIRKIQKPEPTNKPEPIEFWVGRLQTQVMSLMDRLSKIEDELRIKSMNKPVKKQLK